MRTHTDQPGFRKGASLVEVALCLLLFMVVALGSMYYRYTAVLMAQHAQAQLAGADLAVTLLEAWQGLGGSESYGPETALPSFLTVSAATGGSAPSGYTLLGAYDIIIGDRTYRSTLYWKDTQTNLRELGVAVSWPFGDEQQKTFQLTTYARI
jgi:Tfp pilus assembly protein PilV